MMVVNTMARKSFGFAGVFKQIFQNPYTEKSLAIFLSSRDFAQKPHTHFRYLIMQL
jgi:hypothetical protein